MKENDITIGLAEWEASQMHTGETGNSPIGESYWSEDPIVFDDGSIAQRHVLTVDDFDGQRDITIYDAQLGIAWSTYS